MKHIYSIELRWNSINIKTKNTTIGDEKRINELERKLRRYRGICNTAYYTSIVSTYAVRLSNK